MLLLILYSGLHFKGSSTTNDVAWLDDQNGIRFDHQGIAYAPTVAPTLTHKAPGDLPFSMAFAIKPLATSDDGNFRFIVLLHGGDDAEQLVVGQWRSWLVMMNGDDYDARRKRARMALNVLQLQKERLITITSGKDGTAVFVDGELTQKKKDLILDIPKTTHHTRLVLGNSIYGRHPWVGEIYGLVYYAHALSEPVIQDHYQQWTRQGSFRFDPSQNPVGLYLFNEGQGPKIGDHAGGQHDIKIPDHMAILTKEFLAAEFGNAAYNRSFLRDMAINIAGFIPMGVLLAALLWRANRRDLKKQLLLVILTCGAISLMIELAQAWIPSRSSQLMDFILNMLGAGIGVIGHNLCRNYLGKLSPETRSPK